MFGKSYDGLIDDITKTFMYLDFEAAGVSHNAFLSPFSRKRALESYEVLPATIVIPKTVVFTEKVCINSFSFHKTPKKLVLLLFFLSILLLLLK